MTGEQRFFRRKAVFVLIAPVLFGLMTSSAMAGKRALIAEGRLSVEIPDGWEVSELNSENVLAGYATQDSRSSVFFKDIDSALGGSMQDILDGTVFNFEQRFAMKKVGEAKTGQVQGPTPEKKWPAIFTTMEATVVKGQDSFEMKFYLLIFDTGDRLYTVQVSTTVPVRDVRERQIYEMIRSIIAKS